MKRDEKNQITRRRIMDSALHEFSAQGYGASSINTICASQNISKGNMYHYFETKDTLYLACVQECFQSLTEYIQSSFNPEKDSLEEQLKHYFTVRMHFFNENPVYLRIFCEAIISPPSHLKDEIAECRKPFDEINGEILRTLLSHAHLCKDISPEELIDIFRQFQDFINIRYQMVDMDNHAFEKHEESCLKALHILLYGIIERKGENEE